MRFAGKHALDIARKLSVALALLAPIAAAELRAEKSTVCTVTVNSADEREAFHQHLPEDQFRFVELAELGRRDWLGSACRQQVRCDVLVISGHFAGTDFYSSQHGEHLPVDEMERVACSDSCPGLFSQLKEVYLFGCDTLKAEPVRSATPEIVRSLLRAGHTSAEAARIARTLSERHGESARDRMRRLFPNVPVIYGFSSLAPYGRIAGPMLRRHLESGPAHEVGSGEASQRLLTLFGPSSMVVASGQRPSDSDADYRAEACRYYDDRITNAQRLEFMRGLLGGEVTEARMAFDRIERFFASLGDGERQEDSFAAALDAMARDRATRDRYLAVVRATHDPALRVRMISLARTVGWLTQAEQRSELVGMIVDMLAESSTGFGEVDLICALNGDRSLDQELHRFKVSSLPAKASTAAALACLGSAESHSRVLRALASASEQEVQVAQAYFRHRPISDTNELRAAAKGIARMKEAGAQVRALDTLGRHHIADPEVLEELTRLFARSTNLGVQRAIAEVFIRSGPQSLTYPELVAVLRRHRVKSPDADDLIEVLIRRLQAS